MGHGYDLESLPPTYVYGLSIEEHRLQGRVPDDALLSAARAPMVMLAAGALCLLYLTGRALDGVAAGLMAAMLAGTSPYGQAFLVRSVSEAPLIFFLLLALLLGVVGARRGRDGSLPIGWAVALGVALGLGLASKLTAVLSLAAVLGWGVLLAVLATTRVRVRPEDASSGGERVLAETRRRWG